MTYNLRQKVNSFKPQEQELIEGSLAAIELQKRRIFNLLNLFKFGSNKQEIVNLGDLLSELITFIHSYNKTIHFKKSFDSTIPEFYCLKSELSMLLYNIIKNAVDAIEEYPNLKQGKISIHTRVQDSVAEIVISDNGVGMSEDMIREVFEFGYTTKEHGVGIGLYFVKQTLQEKFKGIIEVQSKKGIGTAFTISLPLNQEGTNSLTYQLEA